MRGEFNSFRRHISKVARHVPSIYNSASCATRLSIRHRMSVNLFAPRGNVTKCAQLPNPTPKTDTNLFSCLGAVESDTLSFLMQKLLVRILSLKLFIYTYVSCSFVCHYLHGRASTRSANMQNSCREFVRKMHAGHFVCESSVRRAHTAYTWSCFSTIEFELQIFLSPKCRYKHTPTPPT